MLQWIQGNLFVIVFVSYFGSKLHRPKLIGIGCVIMGVGSITIALPHFFMGYYRYSAEAHDNASDNSLSTCLLEETSTRMETSSERVGKGCEKESESHMWIYVLIGNILRGIGEAPVTPLGISYIDDFSDVGQSSLYIGTVNAVSVIGPFLAFAMGTLFSKMYVDIGFVDLSSIRIIPQDARWVGAWWLNFLVSGFLCIISSIPFFFLPKNPNEPRKQRGKVSTSSHGLKSDEQKNQTANLTSHDQEINMAGLLKSMKNLLTNHLYILSMIFTLLNFSCYVGTFSYLFKYLEQQYGQTAPQANFTLGIIVLPNTVVGMFLGGYLIKKLKLTLPGITKFLLYITCISLMSYLLNFALICENKSVAGLTLTYDGLNPLTSQANGPVSYCNSHCHCDENQWEPVCGDNGITYLSPCLAGCKSKVNNEKSTVFYNCSCMEVSGFPSTNYSAHLGECPRDDDCGMYYYIYIIVQVLIALMAAFATTVVTVLRIRIVQPDLKSLSMGFHLLVLRTLGGMLAPIYFGAMVDRTCIKWSTTACRTQGVCRMYESRALGNAIISLSSSLKFASIILQVVIIYLVKKKYEGKDGNAFENGGKDKNEVNLESSNNNEHFAPSAIVKETHI
ncbi:solute carrier organic anion transporter family member 1B3 isoform X2 [Octodon degus]|uniref:Solute carrier organic anion transporter family member n=1 Tax=Octodon degus TaxID=10160 RepID=A0A6P6ER75_OCTDE|nr:solute carrier organic anion transporter family member 1B3 isoform X2 [Octodon degus]